MILPVQFKRELKLARIISRGGLTGVGEERANGRHIVDISDVEHVSNEIHGEALAEEDALGDAEIVEDGPGSDAGVAAEIAVEIEQGVRGSQFRWRHIGKAGFLKEAGAREPGGHDGVAACVSGSSGGDNIGPRSERGNLEIVLVASDDVEGPSGTEFDKGGECPIAEGPAGEAVATEFARLVDTAEDEVLALVEERRGAIETGIIAVLRSERRLQIGGVVDGMGPGVGS